MLFELTNARVAESLNTMTLAFAAFSGDGPTFQILGVVGSLCSILTSIL